jgi:hypothetical protein
MPLMSTQPATPASPLDVVIQTLLPYFAEDLRHELATVLPELRIQAARLALEAMQAERVPIGGFARAIERPVDYPLMVRLYNGLADFLRWNLPPQLRKALAPLLQKAAEGDYDPTRQLLFAIARERGTAEAALGRFILWTAIMLNLRIHTWDTPEAEAFGTLRAMESEAQQQLEELLAMPEAISVEVRPLHICVSEMLLRAQAALQAAWKVALEDLGQAGLEELLERTEVLRVLRNLNAQDAATVEPSMLDPSLGSQQLVDRFPHHFSSIPALESRRKRVKKVILSGDVVPPGDRVIDVLMAAQGKKSK